MAAIVTVVVAYASYRAVNEEMQFGFERSAMQVRDLVRFRMQTYVNALNQAKGIFVADRNRVSREAFHQYVQGIDLFKHYPGIQGIGYVPRIAAKDLPAHEAQVRAAGFKSYRVWPRDARADYFPILYIEPFDWRNRRAFGYDMFTERVRHAAMQAAWDSGVAAASGPVTLVQETEADPQPGFLIYVPLYRSTPVTTADRPALLQGFLYAPFRAHDLFADIFKQTGGRRWAHTAVRVLDADGTPLYTRELGASARSNAIFRQTWTLDIAGRPWHLEISEYRASDTLFAFLLPILILLFGLTLSFLLYRIARYTAERHRMQDELLRTRNLESIGVLAGGIAHDFNNILTAIVGNISLARLHLPPRDAAQELLDEAEKALWRARSLTQQLLTFAKGGSPIKQTASLAEVLEETATFALRGAAARLQLRLASDLWPAEFDRGQISQVINNLVLNANQAMPEGGTITINAENRGVREREVAGLVAGDYVRIDVADTGIGIAPANIERIFDPYFTTKEKGTGLGLATSYSIVKRHAGTIQVRSRLGHGTRFTLYLPAKRTAVLAQNASIPPRTGAGRVLVLDDDPGIRALVERLLTRLGYEVETVADCEAMLANYRHARAEGRGFDVAIVDLTIPGGMGGAACMQALLALDPNAVGIVCSGYSNDPVVADFRRHGFKAMVPKPYTLTELGAALALALKEERREDVET